MQADTSPLPYPGTKLQQNHPPAKSGRFNLNTSRKNPQNRTLNTFNNNVRPNQNRDRPSGFSKRTAVTAIPVQQRPLSLEVLQQLSKETKTNKKSYLSSEEDQKYKRKL